MGRSPLPLLCWLITVLLSTACVKRAGAPPTVDAGELRQRSAAAIRTVLQSPEPRLQYTAARYVLELPREEVMGTGWGEPPVGEALLARLTAGDTSLQTRQWFIDLLAGTEFWTSLGPEKRREHLAWALEDRSSQEMERREVAAYALFRLGGEDYLKELVPLVPDKERTVRAIVAEAYGKLGDGTQWSTLHRFAEDENPYVRLRAAKALANWIARLGTEVDLAQTKALLEQLKADEDTHVRLMARQAEGIGLMNDPLGYRVTISSPLLTGRSPDPLEDQEEWDAFVDVALGEFDWSLGYNLPVPSEASRMVFELLWEDYPDLQPKVLEAVARGPRAGESGFLQTAWASGEPGLQARGLELMTELLLEEGELGEEFDETIREVAGSELAELEPPVRTAAVRFLLTLARSRTIARFKPEEVTTWKEAVTSLYYSPRDTVRQLVTTLNPTHPWLAEAAKGRFADDAQLRPTIPRLHRMVWYREDPQAIDPKTGEMDPETVHPLTAEDLDQLWRWEILPPLHTLESVLPAEGVSPSIAGIRAAALVLRGEMKSTAEEALTPKDREDWVDPEPGPQLPEDSNLGRGT